MEQEGRVSSSTGGSGTEITMSPYDWELPVIVRETLGKKLPLAPSDMANMVPHLTIQKRFYDGEEFRKAVENIQKGCEVDSLWHFCPSRQRFMVGVGKEGTELDPLVQITPEKFQSVSQKHRLQRHYHIVRNCIRPRIHSSRQEIELCYPLHYWMMTVRDSRVVETGICNLLEHDLGTFPILFPHARRMLGKATRQVLIGQWRQLKETSEKLEILRNLSSHIKVELQGVMQSAFRLCIFDLPLSQEPLVLTWYDNAPDCDGENCRTFARSGCFDTNGWLFGYQYEY
jgi:hypothetical protein